ncbi:beta-1,3-galactosyltransferase 5-like [Lutzomyia longipalpis]|uniref:beta-1,3-galactosyltransferase 5-like n=1 Tax=Lutzomyia longipalpis TaxID=7200 RepID=UPI00248359DE|nr:beta-1,3-galactosyltransferase 5-like [Lutzomyia longipalpis]
MTELSLRPSRRKCWIIVLLVFISYTLVVWYLAHSHKYTLKFVNKYLEVVEEDPEPVAVKFVASDRRFLVDLRNFDYTINQKSCLELEMNPKFIVLVHSAPTKRENRDNIRQTWGGWKVDHRVIFLLGAVSSQDIQREIQIESDFFGDIVQGNFVDSYKNLTYKHIMAMKWATEFCPEAEFIFKSDDDIFVNTPLILKFIQKLRNRKDLIFCHISWGPPVIRDKNSKWYVSPEEYPNATYPVYCPGCAVLLTSDVAQKLHKAAETTPFFWVDDVYVLGTLREKIKARITHGGGLIMGSHTSNEIIIHGNYTEAIHYMFSFELKNQQIKLMWQMIQKP